MSISDSLENVLLDATFNATAYTGPSGGTVYVSLHTGDPGEACTSNAFTDTTRASVTFANASGGSVVSDAAATWSSLSAGGTISHIALWSASSAGTALWSGALTASKTVASGDQFQIPSGSLTVSLD